MISCYLMGGLGNQFFQISTAYALAKNMNDELGIDFYKGDFTQKPAHYYYDFLYKKIKKIDINSINFSNSYVEKQFNYSEIPKVKNLIIKGYFQSEKYFEQYYEEIYNLFVNHNIINKFREKLSFENSLSLHIRRGDYLTKPNYHPTPNLEYYFDAIKHVDSKYKIDKIYIFSDDIAWCENNFSDNRCIFVRGLEDYEELHMMSLCEHNIIANSSFSWWGSYFNLNKNKIVIAPKIWFGSLVRDSWQDIYYKKTIVL